jgi:hypothetical protein
MFVLQFVETQRNPVFSKPVSMEDFIRDETR